MTQGKLKIFFGAAVGVGKTYAMLQEAQDRQAAGMDVVVGWVETHGQAATAALLDGLDVLPRRQVGEYGGDAFDLDAALARRPQLLVVDELAHSNGPGMRHAKRWQDVDELLQAGIDVYTTVNVQELESLTDVVTQITGLVVQETVPDAILERAAVELVDLPPDELQRRVEQGQVQPSAPVPDTFWRKGNLIALRELALRQTAARVDAEMQAYRQDHAVQPTWPAAERILVCVSASPNAPRLVRSARRMAAGLRAEWVVVYVETPAQMRLPQADRERAIDTLRLAERLGAETATLSGSDVSHEVLAYARRRNVSKIVVGKPTHPYWRDWVFGSVLEQLIRHSGDIDVYVISGVQAEEGTTPVPRLLRLPPRTSKWSAYGLSLAVVLGCTALAWLMYTHFAEANIVMVYLLGVVIVAGRVGRGPAVLASILSVAAFDFFFVPPFYTFVVAQAEYLITFAVMLVGALVISTLTLRLQVQAQRARDRERRTAVLYGLSRDLANLGSTSDLLRAAVAHVQSEFAAPVAALLPNAAGELGVAAAAPQPQTLDERERQAAAWCFAHGSIAGCGTDTLPEATGLYLPLSGSHSIVGVLGIWPQGQRRQWEPEQLHLLEIFANQTAIGVERAKLAAEAEQGRVQIEAERLRNTLLSSVSHDLRTPLASITGAASSLLEDGDETPPTVRRDLLQTIYEEGERLNRLVSNLLDMTRLESGGLVLHKEWHPLEEVVGAALAQLERQLTRYTVVTRLPSELVQVPLDDVLIEQVLVNLLENAVKYTPVGSTIEIEATVNDHEATLAVADRGPGLAAGEELRIFDKFYRGARVGRPNGVGLGLAICRAIVDAHGGRIWAGPRPGGGTVFAFALPVSGQPPALAPAPVNEMADARGE